MINSQARLKMKKKSCSQPWSQFSLGFAMLHKHHLINGQNAIVDFHINLSKPYKNMKSNQRKILQSQKCQPIHL